MHIEYAQLSFRGHRPENQDRSLIVVREHAALLVVVDGMGGHQKGALAAEIAVAALQRSFAAAPDPLENPELFLQSAIRAAHADVVEVGLAMPLDQRPRATCAACLVSGGVAYFAHVGDARVYHLRGGRLLARTRDHSHVERLLRLQLIRPEEVAGHPLGNIVERCIGGDPYAVEATLDTRPLSSGDVVLACSDGFWSGLSDTELAAALGSDAPLDTTLNELAEFAIDERAPHSDNVTVAALRFVE